MADTIFNTFKLGVMAGDFAAAGKQMDDSAASAFKVLLLDSGYAIDATDQYVANLSTAANELNNSSSSTSGYSRKALTSVSLTNSSGTIAWDAANVAWSSATFTARYAVIYKENVASDPLVCVFDFGANKSVAAGTFTLQFSSSGIMTLT